MIPSESTDDPTSPAHYLVMLVLAMAHLGGVIYLLLSI